MNIFEREREPVQTEPWQFPFFGKQKTVASNQQPPSTSHTQQQSSSLQPSSPLVDVEVYVGPSSLATVHIPVPKGTICRFLDCDEKCHGFPSYTDTFQISVNDVTTTTLGLPHLVVIRRDNAALGWSIPLSIPGLLCNTTRLVSIPCQMPLVTQTNPAGALLTRWGPNMEQWKKSIFSW